MSEEKKPEETQKPGQPEAQQAALLILEEIDQEEGQTQNDPKRFDIIKKKNTREDERREEGRRNEERRNEERRGKERRNEERRETERRALEQEKQKLDEERQKIEEDWGKIEEKEKQQKQRLLLMTILVGVFAALAIFLIWWSSYIDSFL